MASEEIDKTVSRIVIPTTSHNSSRSSIVEFWVQSPYILFVSCSRIERAV